MKKIKNTLKNKFNSSKFLDNLLDVIVEHLKGRVFKLALKKLVGTSTGVQAWLIKFATENLWDELVSPLISAALVEIKYTKHKIEGNITAEKIKKARESGNEDDYDRAVDAAFD